VAPRSFRSALAVLLLFLVGAGGVMSIKAKTINEPSTVSGLPHTDQSWIANQIQEKLPSSSTVPAIVVFYRIDKAKLTTSEFAAISATATPLAHAAAAASPAASAFPLGMASLSKDGRVALLMISISSKPNDNAVSARVTAMRDVLKKSPINGVSTAVTGAPGFVTDLGHVFDGADTNLLLARVIVVALLLIATYRSPVLWLVPLIVVGMADQISASIAAHLAPHVGIRLDGASTGIAQVIVFGAGTDYALLLIARYRDQLRHEADRFVAMRTALRKTTESIVASSGTVAIALGLLLTASLMGTRALGFAAGIGIVVAALFGLFILPASVAVFGRGLFWPLVPRNGDESHRDGRVFGRIGAAVAKRPRCPDPLKSVHLL
jgi:putative drug exporter of the RND superfamily